jgi:hypothetical protein
MAADKLAYPNGTDLASSQLAQQGAHARDAIDQFVSSVPKGATPEQAAAINEYKAIKGDYGASKSLLDATSQANAGAKGIHIPFLGGEVGNQVVSGARNSANAALAGAAGKAVAGAGNPFSIGKVAGRNIGGSALIDALTGAAQPTTGAQPANGQQTPADLTSAIQNATQGQQQPPDQSGQDSGNPFSQANIEAAIANDIQTTGGKNISQLVSLYNTFGKPDAAAQALTTNQKNEVVSQQKANDLLKTYATNLQNAGGGEGPLMGAVSKSVIGQYTNPKAHAIAPNKMELAAGIAGALNPRGTVSPTVSNRIADMLPTITDNPDVVQAKLQLLQSMISAGGFSATTPVSQLAAGQ